MIDGVFDKIEVDLAAGEDRDLELIAPNPSLVLITGLQVNSEGQASFIFRSRKPGVTNITLRSKLTSGYSTVIGKASDALVVPPSQNLKVEIREEASTSSTCKLTYSGLRASL